MHLLLKLRPKMYLPFPFIQWSEGKIIITHVMIRKWHRSTFSSMHPALLYADYFLQDYISGNTFWLIELCTCKSRNMFQRNRQ